MKYNPGATSDKLPLTLHKIPYIPLKKVPISMYKKY